MMKKYLFIIIILLSGCLQLAAQTKGDWGELYATFDNSFFITDKNSNLQSRVLYTPNITLGMEVRVYKEWTVYGEMEFSLSSSNGFGSRIDEFGLLAENSTMVPLDDIYNNRFENLMAYNFGFAYRFYAKGWRFAPQVGFRIRYLLAIPVTQSYTLKEIGTNNLYIIDNRLGDLNEILYSLQFRLKTERKLSKRISLNMSLGYNLYLTRLNFKAECVDYYTYQSLKTIEKKSRPHELTLSLGLGFR